MKIVSKEIKPDGSQFIVYLMDETERPLKAKITNKEEKTELINNLLNENNLDGLKENISFQIKNIFPSILVTSLNIIRNDDTNSITVQLKYSVTNSNINDNLTLQL